MADAQIQDLTRSAAALLLSLGEVPRFLTPEEFDDGHLLQRLGLINIGLGSSLDGQPPRNALLTDLGQRIKALFSEKKATEKPKLDRSVFERHDRIVTTIGVYLRGDKQGDVVVATVLVRDCTYFEARSVGVDKFFEELPDAAVVDQGSFRCADSSLAIDRGEEPDQATVTEEPTQVTKSFRIEKGKTYRNGYGHPVKILRTSWLHPQYFVGDDGTRYSPGGWYESARSQDNKRNLVSLVN